MLSYSFKEMEQYTKPLCRSGLYEKKLDNFKKVVNSFVNRNEFCRGLPIQIHLEPSGACNLYCPICPRGRELIDREGFLSFAEYAKVFDLLSETLSNIVLSGFGEPLLNDQTTQMIAYTTKNSVSTYMNTNGTVLAESVAEILDAQLTMINISMDGATSKSCHEYNETYPFENVVAGVETLSTLKNKGNYQYPLIYGQFILNDETVDEMEKLKTWALSLGVEHVRFKRKHPTMPGEMTREKIFTQYDYGKILEKGKVKTSENLNWSQSDCSHPWDSFFLSCTGKIGMCSFDPHQILELDADPNDFAKAWNSDLMRKVRRWHSGQDKDVKAPCLTCNRMPGYLLPVENED